MFYSSSLLSKTGPLAKAWLAANLERKLSKNHIINENLQDTVDTILHPSADAPLSLRLTAQLLLGVVRIYSRKARYLLDDCHEAQLKIKMAFGKQAPGNNDLTAAMAMPNRDALIVQDKLTPLEVSGDLPGLAAVMNLDIPLSQLDDVTSTPMGRKNRVNNREINLQEDFDNSQFLHSNMDKEDAVGGNMDELELELDFGLDEPNPLEQSIEVGRDAPAPRGIDEDMLSEFDYQPREKDQRDRDVSRAHDYGDDNVRIADAEGDILMGDDDFQYNLGEQSTLAGPPDMSRARISESPLSDVDEDDVRQGEMEYTRHTIDLYDPDPVSGSAATAARKAPQRAKKRRVLLPDDETMLSSAQIREQQVSHENIVKPQTFIPRDPYVLALQEMQKSNAFVTNILFDGRSAAWAPELRGILSLEAIIRPLDLKRKRDSGVADMDSDSEHAHHKSPRLQVPEDDPFGLGDDHHVDRAGTVDGTILEIPADDMDHTERPFSRDGDTMLPAFDDTVAPLVHPADSGVVSLGTKHAVHILRDLFGAEAEHNAEKRKKPIVFQELLPPARTTKADATKMFFECLVLATKDAIKVEQAEGTLGGNIRVRGKRGLWGSWAEREAGGEMQSQMEADQMQQQEQQQQQQPEHVIAGPSATVSVEA